MFPSLLDDPFPRSWLKKALSTERNSLIGLWLQNEATGLICYDRSGNAHNGVYTDVTLGQAGVPRMGYTCPLFGGVTSYNNIYSAELAAAFNGAEGTLIMPAWVYNADVWSDGKARYFISLYVDEDNRVLIKMDGAAHIYWTYKAGGTTQTVGKSSMTTIDVMWLGFTWSKSAGASGEVKGYYNSAQEETTKTGLGTWAGDLNSSKTCIGSLSITPSVPYHGWIGPVVLWNKAVTAARMKYLMKV